MVIIALEVSVAAAAACDVVAFASNVVGIDGAAAADGFAIGQYGLGGKDGVGEGLELHGL